MQYKRESEAAARRWCSVNEVAALLGISSPTLYRAIQEGQFPAVRIRGRLIVPMQAVEEMQTEAVAARHIVNAAAWVASAHLPEAETGTEDGPSASSSHPFRRAGVAG